MHFQNPVFHLYLISATILSRPGGSFAVPVVKSYFPTVKKIGEFLNPGYSHSTSLELKLGLSTYILHALLYLELQFSLEQIPRFSTSGNVPS